MSLTQHTTHFAMLREALSVVDDEPQLALAKAQEVLRIAPDFPPAYRVAAIANRRLGLEGDAERLELEGIAVGLRQPMMQEAQACFKGDRLEEAEKAVRAYLKQDPEDPGAALILAEIAKKCGAQREAENLFKRAILLAPAYSEARMALAKAQRDAGQYDCALVSIDQLLAREPRHLKGLSLKAAIYVQNRRFELAEATFKLMLDIYPGDTRAWMNYGFMLKTVGRQNEAIAAYRKSIECDLRNGQAWWGLANLKTIKFDSSDVAAMRAALADQSLAGDDRLHLLFALGKALDDIDDPAGAFEAFSLGAKQRLEQTPHDPNRVFENVKKATSTFSSAFFVERGNWGCKARDAIFIVSLPRSGSTLVEQILASHPLIEGTEELYDIERIAINLGGQKRADAYLEKITSLSSTDITALGQHYIDATRRFRFTDKPHFTDKMPSNWVFTGLISTMLPNAKIIDVRRHPLGCGFANFSQHFNWGINFSYDLAHIGQFYTAYVRQMAHFDDILPGHVHHLTYEALVEDTEGEVRRMLDYLELPFDPACLRFFENSRAVYTPSSEQVRSPINRDGMERWRKYEPWLGPLKEALGPVLEHYPKAPPFEG